MKTLEGKVCLVAGATRGAGRGIALALGEQGATVYCSGRSVRGQLASGASRPETIDETAERVTARGGRGVAVQADHTDEAQVAALCRRLEQEHGGLDLLVNDVWGGDELIDWEAPFWKQDLSKARTVIDRGLWTHVVTARHAAPLLIAKPGSLLVEITDGDGFGYRGTFFYDLVKFSLLRVAFDFARELEPHGVTALALTPGFLRSEAMLARFGVTEATWRDGTKVDPNFIASETPLFVGRAVAALAADPKVFERRGRVFSSWQLAREYGFDDADGRRPDWGAHFEQAYGRPAAPDYASWRDGPFDLFMKAAKPPA